MTIGSPSVVSFPPPAETLTYEPYFGLNEKPFSLNADSRFVYESPNYVATYNSLLAGIRRREGLLVLTGQIGNGKTTLCRSVLEDLGRTTYASLVPDPFASREDLLKMMLIDFGALSIQDLTTGPLRQASRTELGYLLSEFLNALSRDAFVVVVIDEAQNLSLPLIEETRILADTFGARGRLQIIFVGQPELHAKLKSPEMRQVDQRVCGYHRLEPMTRDAVAGYIEHRLEVAGGHRDRVLFAPSIIDLLYQRTGGVPRLINRVCDRALQIAFDRKAESVERPIIDTALLEVGSATLSPTWDSIFFAEPAPPPHVAPDPAPSSTAGADPEIALVAQFKPEPVAQFRPEPVSEPSPEPVSQFIPEPVTEVGHEPLAHLMPEPAPSELPAPAEDREFPEQIDEWVAQDLVEVPPPPAPPAAQREQRRAPRHVPLQELPRRTSRSGRRFDTRLQKIRRVWTRRAAIALAVLIGVNMVMAGATLLREQLAAPELPRVPDAPPPPLPASATP